ncbi:MAG: TatD family hydrolase [Actinomycetota bacterium]
MTEIGGWVDSHCHLDSLEKGPALAVAEAVEAGVTQMVNVGTDLKTSVESIRLAQEFESVWAAVGIHPHDASHADDVQFEQLAELAEQPKVVAIGEIGLDFYRDHSPRDVQVEAFRAQLQIAKSAGKCVVLHIREAHPEAFEVLESVGGPWKGLVFHCFSAGPAEAARAVEMGGYISFAGNISYKKSDAIRRAAASVPVDRLLVETDSPYLAPVPFRGKPNEPALVIEVGKALAEAIGHPLDEVERITRENAQGVFALRH